MDFEVKYKGDFLELESHVRNAYRKGIEAIRKSDDFEECLSELSLISKAVGNSKYGTGRSSEWAGDLIKLYRNLGEIFATVLSDAEVGYREYRDLLDEIIVEIEFEGENDRETLRNILNSYNETKRVLDSYNLGNPKELKSRLEAFDSLKERFEELQEREDKRCLDGLEDI